VSIFKTLKYIVRHPTTWRVVESLDEIWGLIQAVREAVKDEDVTQEEVEEIIDNLQACVKALMEE